jgi:Ca2+-transporting ATPase
MVVQRVQTPSYLLRVTGDGYEPLGEFKIDRNSDQGQLPSSSEHLQQDPEVRSLLLGCVLCNDADLQQENQQWTILGDPTEGALLALAGKGQLEKGQLSHEMPRSASSLFLGNQRMSTICKNPSSEGSYSMYTKGSPELTLDRCTQIQQGEEIKPLTPEKRSSILRQNNQMAAQGWASIGICL